MPRGYGASSSYARESAAQSNRFGGGGYRSTTTRTRPTPTRSKPKFSFKPIAVKVIEGLASSLKKSKQNVMDYEGQAAGVTPMRNPFPTRNGGGNDRDPQYKPTTTIKPILSSPTTAEVSQATATTAVAPVTTPEEIAETEETRKRRTKRRGRSLTILTGSSGATGGLTLGIPSLLGR